MALLDFTLPGSDPTTPNTFIQTPQQVAYQQALAQQLMNEGSSTAPIRSPWQGAANLAKALMGGWQMGDAARQQRLGQADATAAFGSAIGADPGNLDIPSTPGASTATLRASDALQDQIQDTGVDPRRAAMVAALGGGGGGTPAAGGGAPALAAALGGVNGSSRGMRNNNPGNLEANGWTSNLPGYKGTDGRFAIFDTPEHGVAAMDANLQGYARKGINTPLAIASTWAPGSEQGNNPGSYGGAIARALGVGLNDKIDMSDPATRAKVESAMALVENGPKLLPLGQAAAAASKTAMPMHQGSNPTRRSHNSQVMTQESSKGLGAEMPCSAKTAASQLTFIKPTCPRHAPPGSEAQQQ